MIPLSALAEFIEDGLNKQENIAALTYPYGTGSVSYQFRVLADTTDYKKPTREGNTVTHYIHGILYMNGSNIETSKGGYTNATLDTTLELAVPVLDGMDDEGNKELVEKVRKMLDTFFAENGDGSILYDGVNYSFGFQYKLSDSGMRQALQMIGDAFMFRVSQTWVFLPNGIKSDDISLTIDGSPVPFTTIGLMRSAVQETDVRSDSTNAIGKNVTASTMLTINVGMTAITGAIFTKLRSFILNGTLASLAVSLTVDGATSTYTMIFNDGTLNGQIPLYASATFKLVEVL